MARKITFNLEEKEFDFSIEKLDRTKLYGSRDVVAVDPGERPLHKGYLDEWGSVVISSTGMGYIDAEKTWRDKSELQAVDASGQPLDLLPSSFDAPITLEKTCDLEFFCGFEIVSVYLMEGFQQQELHEHLSAMGDSFYCFPFVYRAGYEAKTAFLQASGDNLFMLLGVRAKLEFLSKPQRTDLDDESGDDDDLDFSMM